MNFSHDDKLNEIAERTIAGQRLSFEDGLALYATGDLPALGPIALAGVIATGALLVYQHRLVRADDLQRLNAAFFTTNAFVSVILLVTFGSAVFLHR